MTSSKIAVLVMAYGTPRSLDDDEIYAYLRHITQFYRGADPDPGRVRELTERYRSIGLTSLYDITHQVADGMHAALERSTPDRYSTYVAMKHSPPLIDDTVRQMADDGITTGIGVALAPFRSRLSTEGYYKLIDDTNAGLPSPMTWSHVHDWHLAPEFLGVWERLIRDSLDGDGSEQAVVFTNHSLPERIREWDDPYPDRFAETAHALAERCGLSTWTTAYQSAGGGNQAWLGPDLVDVIKEWAARGHRRFLIAPIGFLTDHLEVRFDIDVRARDSAKELGVELTRTDLPQDDAPFVEMLAGRVLKMS